MRNLWRVNFLFLSADDVAFTCERFTCSHGRNWITINYYRGRTLHRVRYGRSSVSQPRRRALLTSGIAQTARGVRQSARYTCGSHRERVLACITLLQRNHFRDFYVSLCIRHFHTTSHVVRMNREFANERAPEHR